MLPIFNLFKMGSGLKEGQQLYATPSPPQTRFLNMPACQPVGIARRGGGGPGLGPVRLHRAEYQARIPRPHK